MPRATDRVELNWLATVRWATIAASGSALVFGRTALDTAPATSALLALAVATVTNLKLFSDAQRGRPVAPWVPGALVSMDVAVLTVCLLRSGGVLNPVSIVFLVDIVLAAFVLGRPWTWVITLLSVAGYGVQLLAPTPELAAAQTMHPQIAQHVRGMWWAFAFTASVIGVLVARLATAIERRDRRLAALHDDAARRARVVGLATMAAGAAHELSTPLGTIAVAAGELSRTASTLPGGAALDGDLALIRAELDRSRRILTALSGRADDGGTPATTSIAAVIDAALAQCPAHERARVTVDGDASIDMTGDVTWPSALVARALGNVIGNALLADPSGAIHLVVAPASDDRVTLTIVDRGAGMDRDTVARAGEPFFTTRAANGGMGLGLFVARAAAEQIGGELTIDSSTEAARGTTVRITLPRHADMRPRP